MHPRTQRITNTNTFTLRIVTRNHTYMNIMPSTPQTTNLLSGDVFASASAKAPVFINVGRGDVVDEVQTLAIVPQGNCTITGT